MAESSRAQSDNSHKKENFQPKQVTPGVTNSLAVLQRAQTLPGTLRPADVLHLQRTIGNRATERLLQAKLQRGPTDDASEQEAEDVAPQVMRASHQTAVQRVSRYADLSYAPSLTPQPRPAKRAFVAPPKTPAVQREEEDEIGGQGLIAHQLTHTPQQGAAAVQRQPDATNLIQRTPDETRLSLGLGARKFKKIKAADQLEYFDKLTDDQLERYKGMRNDQFDKLVDGLKKSLLDTLGVGVSYAGEKTATVAQIADLLGAAVETGEDSAKVIEMLPQLLGSMSGMISAGTDTAMEGFGGFTGGVKDTYEGGSSILKQQKYVEGGLTTLGGISGLLSLVPGVPDVVGMAGAGAKSLAGVTKIANIRINQSAINKLRKDGGTNSALQEALGVLEAKLDFWSYMEGGMQTGLGAVEGVGAYFGSIAKWTTAAVSKGTETAYNWLPYIGRGLGSYTGLVDSNTTVKENEEKEKVEGKRKMWKAVESVESGGLPEHIGRLHRLAVLIDKDYADEIDLAVSTLQTDRQKTVKDAIKLKATWNPS